MVYYCCSTCLLYLLQQKLKHSQLHLPNSLHEPRVKSLVIIPEVNPSPHTGYRRLVQNNHKSTVSQMDQDFGYFG